jgi:hypothetical protein
MENEVENMFSILIITVLRSEMLHFEAGFKRVILIVRYHFNSLPDKIMNESTLMVTSSEETFLS